MTAPEPEVKRYDVDGRIFEQDGGDFVRYEDFAALATRCAAAEDSKAEAWSQVRELIADITTAQEKLAAAEAERDRKAAYIEEMFTLIGGKLHFQDGLEVGGETLRGAILRVMADLTAARAQVAELLKWKAWAQHMERCGECADALSCNEGDRLYAAVHPLPTPTPQPEQDDA